MAKAFRECEETFVEASGEALQVSWEINNGFEQVQEEFHPPFSRIDREKDYTKAYNVFEKELGR